MSCGCNDGSNIAEFIAQKFGYQRVPSGVGEAQKSMNQFQFEVVYPTNWRVTWSPLMSMYPQLGIRYGASNPPAPYFYERNYSGIMPLKQQPTIDAPQPYAVEQFT
jgi:hypothetical protein